jgi:hypothetical protein
VCTVIPSSLISHKYNCLSRTPPFHSVIFSGVSLVNTSVTQGLYYLTEYQNVTNTVWSSVTFVTAIESCWNLAVRISSNITIAQPQTCISKHLTELAWVEECLRWAGWSIRDSSWKIHVALYLSWDVSRKLQNCLPWRVTCAMTDLPDVGAEDWQECIF